MKKMKILAPLMASVVIATPILTSLTSCGKIDYTEKISEIKDLAITYFLDLCSTTHRAKWDEGELYNYVVRKMESFGFENPSGRDLWSQVPEVKAQINKELSSAYPLRPRPDKEGTQYQNYGNIWYDIPATKGKENATKIIITAHMDTAMSFKNEEAKNTYQNAKTKIIDASYDRDNEILKSTDATSLGADDGLGVATMLAIAQKRNNFSHGPIRLIFTAGESEATLNYPSGTALLKIDQIDNGMIDGKKYLVDGSTKPFGTKDEFPLIISTSGIYKNSVYCSSAGIHECEFNDTHILFDRNAGSGIENDYQNNYVDWELPREGQKLNLYTISISGLHGGQSSKYINEGYASALQLMMDLLFTSDYSYRLFEAQSYPDARSIPPSASATFATVMSENDLRQVVDNIITSYKTMYPNDSWETFQCKITSLSDAQKVNYKWSMSPKQSRAFTKLCAVELLYGPYEWFDKEHTKIKTSCNFCDLNLKVSQDPEKESTVHMHNVCRSASVNSLERFKNLSHSLIVDACATFYEYAAGITDPWYYAEQQTNHFDKPVWERKNDNKAAELLYNGYKNMGIDPVIFDTHGWIDACCIPEIYQRAFSTVPNITCTGPEIRNSHLINEEVWTDTYNSCLGAILYIIDHV